MQIWAKLKTWSRLQRITLVLFLAMIVNSILDTTIGYQLLGGDAIAVLFAFSFLILAITSVRPLTRKLLWRVRNRLLVTYVLFGVVPIVLIFIMIGIGFMVLFGQIAANMVYDEIVRKTDLLYSPSQRESVSRVHVVPDVDIQTVPLWMKPGFKGILAIENRFYIAALSREQGAGRPTEVLVYAPLDSETLAGFPAELGSISMVPATFRANRNRITIGNNDSNPNPVISATSARPLPPPQGFWDWRVSWPSLLAVKDLQGNTGGLVLTVASRPSLFIPRLFSSFGILGSVLGVVLIVLTTIFLLVEVVSLILSIRLTRSITQAVHDLYVGTEHVARADFSHRIPVRSKDQLSELAGSFNTMTEHIQHLIEEVKEKEKLEAELEIAREVQSQLFPKGVPQIRSLELAGVCNPARVVSGDYYDFVPFAARWTAIVIGDISGKGISAALLMASLQASLHAQLTSMDVAFAPSTAILVARLNRQLYASTSPEKYATFYCAVYDDQNGRLSYTNAGHLPPILVREGNASRLEGNGMVVGVMPDTPYFQTVIQLEKGDLIAAFTDGITESENSEGEEFGTNRLSTLLVENAMKPLEEIVEIVTTAVREWAYDLDNQDDTTMLLARKV